MDCHLDIRPRKDKTSMRSSVHNTMSMLCLSLYGEISIQSILFLYMDLGINNKRYREKDKSI